MKQEVFHNEFGRKYPNITEWVEDGSIEIGRADWGESFVKIFDEGGTVWDSEALSTASGGD